MEPDGKSRAQHLQAAVGKVPWAAAKLEGPALPAAGAHVWTWFRELNISRGYSQAGPNPLAYAEIAAWAQLTQRVPRVWEVAWLRELDMIWLAGGKDDPDGAGPQRPA